MQARRILWFLLEGMGKNGGTEVKWLVWCCLDNLRLTLDKCIDLRSTEHGVRMFS